MSDHEHNDEPASFHREGGAVVFDKPPSADEAARKRREDEQHEFARAQVKTNRTLAWFTGALVVATFCTIGVGVWQATISRTAANAARDAVAVASNTLSYTQLSNARQAAERIQGRADEQIEEQSTRKAADHALGATIKNFQLDQRAWVAVKDVTLDSPFSTTEKSRILIQLINTGHTPAIGSYLKCFGIGLDGSGCPTAINISHGPIAPQGVVAIYELVGPVNQAAVDGVKSRTHRVQIAFVLEYQDIFGKVHHTAFCGFYPSNRDPYFEGCTNNGVMD